MDDYSKLNNWKLWKIILAIIIFFVCIYYIDVYKDARKIDIHLYTKGTNILSYINPWFYYTHKETCDEFFTRMNNGLLNPNSFDYKDVLIIMLIIILSPVLTICNIIFNLSI